MTFAYLKAIIPAALFLFSTPEEQVREYVEKQIQLQDDRSAAQNKINNMHAPWEELLKKYVTATGKVNYSGFQSDAKFAAYLETLASNYPSKTWNSNQALAYWLNVYNAYTIKLITDNYPLKSIKDIPSPWATKSIELNGMKFSLNQIENDIIRPKFNDARIHFGINCAAVSCPPLSNTAFTAKNVNSELEKLTRKFVNNTKYNKLAESAVSISTIFDWYKEDFNKSGSVVDYLNKYSNTAIATNAEVSYLNYDWSLNDN